MTHRWDTGKPGVPQDVPGADEWRTTSDQKLAKTTRTNSWTSLIFSIWKWFHTLSPSSPLDVLHHHRRCSFRLLQVSDGLLKTPLVSVHSSSGREVPPAEEFWFSSHRRAEAKNATLKAVYFTAELLLKKRKNLWNLLRSDAVRHSSVRAGNTTNVCTIKTIKEELTGSFLPRRASRETSSSFFTSIVHSVCFLLHWPQISLFSADSLPVNEITSCTCSGSFPACTAAAQVCHREVVSWEFVLSQMKFNTFILGFCKIMSEICSKYLDYITLDYIRLHNT